MEKEVDIFSSIMTKPRRRQRILVRCKCFVLAPTSRQVLALTQLPIPRVTEVKWPKFKVTTPSREEVMNASSYTVIFPILYRLVHGDMFTSLLARF
jgi:hypothetical protein